MSEGEGGADGVGSFLGLILWFAIAVMLGGAAAQLERGCKEYPNSRIWFCPDEKPAKPGAYNSNRPPPRNY